MKGKGEFRWKQKNKNHFGLHNSLMNWVSIDRRFILPEIMANVELNVQSANDSSKEKAITMNLLATRMALLQINDPSKSKQCKRYSYAAW